MPISPSPFRKVLLATDFSAASETALRQAVWLGERSPAELTVAHVLSSLREAFVNLPYDAKAELLSGDIDKFERALRADAQKQLDRSLRRYLRKKIKLNSEVLLGKPETALIRAVLHEQHDLVMCGTRGQGAVKRLLVGSTAQRLVRQSPSAVWVVKAESTCPPERILAAVDFSDLSRRALSIAAWLAEQSKAMLDVVHIVELDELLADIKSRSATDSAMTREIESEATERLTQWCTELLSPKTLRAVHVLWGTPWKILADRSRRWQADLVVLGALGRSGMSGWMLGNMAEKMLGRCDCSLLTVKPADFVSPVMPPFWELHPASVAK